MSIYAGADGQTSSAEQKGRYMKAVESEVAHFGRQITVLAMQGLCK